MNMSKILSLLIFFSLLIVSGCDSNNGSDTTDGDSDVTADGDMDTTNGDNDVASDGDMDLAEVDELDSDADAEAEVEAEEEEVFVPNQFTIVEVDPETSITVQLAIQACACLYNRMVGGSVFIRKASHDELWLSELELEPEKTLGAAEFLEDCLIKIPGCVRYSYNDQRLAMPSILTIASVLGAVPVDLKMDVSCGEVVFDATTELADKNTPYLSTKYVFENYVEQTTGLAMLNPGYEIWENNTDSPVLARDMSPALVDYVFSKKLFTLFLANGCQDNNPEKELLHQIVNAGHWSTPLGVYGYNNSWMVMGDFFYEAQTRCLDSRNMGAIPTETGNLSFFSSRRPEIKNTGELEHNEAQNIEYDPNKTYVAFVIGDGDNIDYIMRTRNVWFRQRLADCEKQDNSCEPITWSISPHLPNIAPEVLQWYFKQAHKTGKDYFILPPSGHLYSYPTSMNEQDQTRFVKATEDDARLLGIHGTVHWDWAGTWKDAEEIFLPKYARTDGVVRGIFPVNVPYMLPTFPWWPEEDFYNVLTGKDGGKVVVFRPREWRGIDNDEDPFYYSPQKMSDELGGYPKGTVSWVYMTSDGGLNLENSFMEMVKLLPEHVQLVSADAASSLALQADGE